MFFHINEFNIETKFAGYQFYYFRIESLIYRYHNTKTHTLADNFGKTYIHQVGQFAYTDEFRYLQFIIINGFAHGFSHFLSFFTTQFCLQAFSSSTCAGKFCLCFFYFFLDLFFVDLFFLPSLITASSSSSTSSSVTPIITNKSTWFFIFKKFLFLYSLLFNRDTLSFSFLFFFRSCITINRQINFPKDLRAFQFTGFYIFNDLR